MVDLLDRPDDAAVARYLDLVSDRPTRTDALAALAKLRNPPTECMVQALNDPHVDRRIAAALVLGRIDGPVLTRRLIEMVAADQNRREAFIALASSRGAEASGRSRPRGPWLFSIRCDLICHALAISSENVKDSRPRASR